MAAMVSDFTPYALASLAALPPVALAVLVPESLQSHDRSALPPPAAPQRGPPTA